MIKVGPGFWGGKKICVDLFLHGPRNRIFAAAQAIHLRRCVAQYKHI